MRLDLSVQTRYFFNILFTKVEISSKPPKHEKPEKVCALPPPLPLSDTSY